MTRIFTREIQYARGYTQLKMGEFSFFLGLEQMGVENYDGYSLLVTSELMITDPEVRD